MKILFLTHSFNSLAQRLFVELARRNHGASIEFDINDAVTIEAVAMYKPDLIIAPYLRRAIPEVIWKNHVCLVIHPGIKGDRGPSPLDWAILHGEAEWGVTVLQANAEMDAGAIWATRAFKMRNTSKGSLYRNEVQEAAVAAVLEAVEKFDRGNFKPEPLDYNKPDVLGRYHPLLRQEDRAIDWQRDTAEQIMRKIRSGDGFPGVLDKIARIDCFLYNAVKDNSVKGNPGEIVCQRNGAICLATVDAGVWITHLRENKENERTFKLPAALVLKEQLKEQLKEVPESPEPQDPTQTCSGFREIFYTEKDTVGYLYFDFYNGAMSTDQCQRLLNAYRKIKNCPTRVIVLMGGHDFWSNGIHLNVIEAAENPADESLRNINAINDFAREVILTEDKITVSALQGNAGAGGVFLALASDYVWARNGVILNPHYKNMGNLYGSEYWTYQLPKRVGLEKAKEIMSNRLPIGTVEALAAGLVDKAFGDDVISFQKEVTRLAAELANSGDLEVLLADKRRKRAESEALKPLQQYRAEEIEKLKLNFYGFDPSYHVARYNFVFKIPHSRTPLHLARHRRNSFQD